ncbi:MAG: 2-succinyl-5-enolpyruvyl-6-hydroxy-3-cyclohexene-1-carboxylic-acid synthase [Thermoleophilaceae bacterium]|nr:2-succinyl-5-enolpyruvyl-6-hydroxy-3-cyclohexene-1-carboxylic-acid synthase [Thermoleophilaceae bacterium]
MQPINRTYAPVQAFVDELARCGVRHAVTSPGSRNAPLALVLAEQPGIEAVSVIDERSAGFVAVGIARATGAPVAVTCTSGTAAANLHPAVAEAREASVPLLVLTADRPPELRDVGAGQSIDQLGLYGSAAKWFHEVGGHEPGRATAVHHRGLACRAVATAAGGRPGPVHLNFPLREPLAPRPEDLDAADWEGRPDGSPWVAVEREPGAGGAAALREWIGGAERGVIVCGEAPGEMAAPAAALAAALGWPLLADPASGVRSGPHDRSHVVAHYDVLLRVEAFAAGHRPERVLRVGEPPVSQSLRAWLAGTDQAVIDPRVTWHDPTREARLVAAGDPATLLAELAGEGGGGDPAWVESWRAADAAVPRALAESPAGFEGAIPAALAPALPDDALLWVAHSMPVRDVEAFLPSTPRPLRVLAARGANGIDGVVSAATGAALGAGRPAHLLTGDVALLHDAGGLISARRAGAELTIVCVNNGGGGIFDFLPVAAAADASAYERHVATPHGVDLAELAALGGLAHRVAATPEEVAGAVATPALVEVRTDRAENVRLHAALVERVAELVP